jgi:subtilisin-like proprotein convertase family protein
MALRWRVFAPVAVVCAAALALGGPAAAATYVGGAVTIQDSASPPTASSPYPSTVVVSGEKEIVTSVRVRIFGFTHAFPEDVDLLLVGPGGQTVLLISDAGANPETNESFTVHDGAAAPLSPDSGIGGSFQPTDLDDGTADVFPASAPPGPYGTSLSALAEPSANGTWSLYAVDDSEFDAGSIGGWELSISSRDRTTVGFSTEQLSPTFGFPENVGSVRLLVYRQGSNLRAGGVSYWTAPFYNDPTPGQDYIPQTGRLEWAAGESSVKAIDVPILDDTLSERQESILVGLTAPAGDLSIPRDPYTQIVSIADNEPLILPPLPAPVLGGRKVQRVLRQRGVIVTAKSNVAGSIVATGRIVVPRHLGSIVRFRKVQRQVTAGQTVRVKLGLSRKALRKVRRALTIRETLRATVRLSLTDTLGRKKTATKRLTLKR